MQLSIVNPAYVPQLWDMVSGFLEDGLLAGAEELPADACYTLDHVQGFITSGQWTLITVVNDEMDIVGAITVSFVTYPRQRVAFITLIGGRTISNKDTFDQLCNILRQYGATKIQGYGKPSIVRLWKRYGFEPVTTLIEVDLWARHPEVAPPTQR